MRTFTIDGINTEEAAVLVAYLPNRSSFPDYTSSRGLYYQPPSPFDPGRTERSVPQAEGPSVTTTTSDPVGRSSDPAPVTEGSESSSSDFRSETTKPPRPFFQRVLYGSETTEDPSENGEERPDSPSSGSQSTSSTTLTPKPEGLPPDPRVS